MTVPLVVFSSVVLAVVYSYSFYRLHNSRATTTRDEERWMWVKALPTIAVGAFIGIKGALEGDEISMDFISRTLPLYGAQIVAVDQVLKRFGVYDRLLAFFDREIR